MMKKRLILVFLGFLMAPLIGILSKDDAQQTQSIPSVMVDNVVRSLAGTWTGRTFLTDIK